MGKLYIGNLNFSVTDSDLIEFFSVAGTVLSARVIKFRESGKSRGFAFIQMAGDGETTEAMKLNNTDFKGRKIIVREALPEGQHKTNELKPFFDFINGGAEMILDFVYQGNKYTVSKQGVDFIEKPTEQPIL